MNKQDEFSIKVIKKMEQNVERMDQINNKKRDITLPNMIEASILHGMNQGIEWVIDLLSEVNND